MGVEDDTHRQAATQGERLDAVLMQQEQQRHL